MTTAQNARHSARAPIRAQFNPRWGSHLAAISTPTESAISAMHEMSVPRGHDGSLLNWDPLRTDSSSRSIRRVGGVRSSWSHAGCCDLRHTGGARAHAASPRTLTYSTMSARFTVSVPLLRASWSDGGPVATRRRVRAPPSGANRVKAVIFAGGHGTRISEESGVRPKPLVEIGGRPSSGTS